MKKLIILILLMSSQMTLAAVYYVDGNVAGSGDGSESSPFNSIQEAADLMNPGDSCLIKAGIYSETISPIHSGTKENPIVFQPLSKKDVVVITGLDPIPSALWEKESEHIFKAKVTMELKHENQVFHGEKMMVEARWPNTGDDLLKPAMDVMDAGTTPENILDARLPDNDYTGSHVWIHAGAHWRNWTTKVLGFGKGSLEIENIAPGKGSTSWHVAKKGEEFFVFGCKDALDADNEWFCDARDQTLYIYRSNGTRPGNTIYVKKRMNAFDLVDKANVHIKDVQIRGATIDMNSGSSRIEMDSLKVTYAYHSSQANTYFGNQGDKGVPMMGKQCVLRNSEVAYSSGCGVSLYGQDNQIINCYIHDTDYIGTFASCVQLRGTGNVISHCTLRRSGRTVIDYGGMHKALVQYCDMSESGLLTSDLGLTYGNVIEGGNSEVRYNWLHDNLDDHLDMGLYYDHGTQNIISHHNVVWGVGFAAFLINHYAYYHLAYNNTFSAEKHGFESAWGNKYAPDLYGCRFFNNIFSAPCGITASNYTWGHNRENYKDLIDHKFLPQDSPCIDNGIVIAGITDGFQGKAPDLGAYELGGPQWKVGHDFANPPIVDTTRTKPLYRNRLENTAFEHGDHLSPWFSVKGDAIPELGRKNQITPDTANLRMGGCSMQLGSGAEIAQIVSDLTPNTWYEFAGFLRADRGEQVYLGVRNYGGQETHSPPYFAHRNTDILPWTRRIVHFKTGPSRTSVTVFIRRTTEGEGQVFADDFGLVYVKSD
ncbi:right-handed parallel beta-helix repeat-containing protein [Planctomycetota bacterium]